MIWAEYKDYLAVLTGLSEDALHIYAALLLQIGSALLLRRSLSDYLPLLIVLAITLLNEAGDLYFPGHPIESWQILGGIKDLWNTLLPPTLLFLIVRFCPQIVRPAATRISSRPE